MFAFSGADVALPLITFVGILIPTGKNIKKTTSQIIKKTTTKETIFIVCDLYGHL